jgi:hypothetical protein
MNPNLTFVPVILFALGCLPLQAAAAPVILHVATNGADKWSGKLEAPNKAKTDGPFATVERARDAIRELKLREGGKLKQPVTVFIHGGTYRLSQPLKFTPEDSGSAECPVAYEAFGKDRPVLSGGRTIAGFKDVTVDGKHLWAAEIPEVREGKWYFHQLWIDGERRQRARNPNQGFFRVTAVPDMKRGEAPNIGQQRFQYAPGEIGRYENLQDVDIVVMTFWVSPRLGILNLDTAGNMVTLHQRTPWRLTDGFGANPKLARFYVENAFELLDSPGEWYLNRKTGTLYYMPMPGEDIHKAVAIAPKLDYLLLLDGDANQEHTVEHIAFRGLNFQHAEWWVPREDPHTKAQKQGSVYAPAAIQLTGARECTFESCTVSRISQYAIHLSRGCERNRIVGCEMYDLGTGGVKVGETDAKFTAHHNLITDNYIHHGGLVAHSSHAVWIGQSHDNLVAHNHIHDFYYIAVSAGWSWSYTQPWARGNVIEYNHIHDIGKGWLSDMGAIYTLGVQPGTTIRYNLLHDIQCADYGGAGIYFDMSSAEILAEKNLVYNTSTGGLHQNYGKNNIVRNNIFINGDRSQIETGVTKAEVPGPNQYTFERNIVCWARNKNFLQERWHDTAVVLNKNLYWREGVEPTFGPLSWAKWQALGLDKDSLIADPLFVDPARHDYRLKPDSPAFKLGFEAFDLSQVGPRQPYLKQF